MKDQANRIITPRQRWALIAIVLAAAALRLSVIAHHGLRNNDFITIRAIDLGWMEMVDQRLHQNHVPGYFLMLKAWTTMAGQGEVALRLPSIASGVLGVATLFWVGLLLFGPEVGLIAAGLGMVSQQWLVANLDVRMYGWTMTLGLLALGCAWRWFETNERKWATLYLVTMVLGIGTQLLLLSVPAALAAVCVFNRGDLSWRRRLAAAALMLTPILACVPLLLAWTHAQYKVGHDDWEFEIPGRALRNLLIVAFGDYEVMGGTGKEIIRVVTFPLLGVSLLLLLWHRLQGRWQGQPLTEGRRLGLATVAWVGGLPIIMVVLASLKSNSVDETRYLCVTGAMMPVALAAGWWGCRSPHVRWAGIGLCIVMMLAHTAMHLWGQGDGIREAMFHLRSLGPEGNVSLAVSSSASMNAFDYYGVTMPMTPMDREELSDEEVWATCQAAIRDDTEFLHVFMFHGDDSPAPTLLRYRTPWLEHVGFETFGDSRVTTYRVLPVE